MQGGGAGDGLRGPVRSASDHAGMGADIQAIPVVSRRDVEHRRLDWEAWGQVSRECSGARREHEPRAAPDFANGSHAPPPHYPAQARSNERDIHSSALLQLIRNCKCAYSSIGPTLQLAPETVGSTLTPPTTCSTTAPLFQH